MASPVQIASLGGRDRNINLNVGSFAPNRKHTEKSRWICIYPAYLNSKKTVAEGRQVPTKYAVENPTCAEIRDALISGSFNVEVEVNKVHPREMNKYEMLSRGRVRVQLRNENGTPLKENFKDRKSIMLFVCETIPKLKSRGAGAKAATAAQASASDQSKSSSKSKGKKK